MVLTAYFVLSPVSEFFVVTVISGLRLVKARSGRRASANLTPATGARTTRLRRPRIASFVSAPFNRSQAPIIGSPPCQPVARPTLPRPPHPAPYVRDDRDTPLCVGQDGEAYSFDLGQAGTEIFLQMGLDSRTSEQPVEQISRPVRSSSKRLTESGVTDCTPALMEIHCRSSSLSSSPRPML
jgi:hypothetical protein